MHFNMVRPCPQCPFRHDIPGYLTEDRVWEITDAILSGATFTCHKTTVCDEDEDGECEMVDGPNAEHCAGALIFLEKNEAPNQMMRWMERIGCYDRRKLDMASPVFDDADEMANHHGELREGWCLAPAA